MAFITGIPATGLETGKEPPRQGVGGSVPSVVLEMHEGEESLHIPNGRGEPSNHGKMAFITGIPATGLETGKEPPRQGVGGSVPSVVLEMHEGEESLHIPNGRGEPSNHAVSCGPAVTTPPFGPAWPVPPNCCGEFSNPNSTKESWITYSRYDLFLRLGQLCNQSKIMVNRHCILTPEYCLTGKSQKRFICYDYILQLHYTVSNCFEKYGIHNNKLLELSKSVCQVRTRDKFGSGFLLFKNFILTNFHVIEPYYNFKTRQLTNDVAVTFSHEIQESECDLINVVGVHCYDFCSNFGNKSDWVLLEINDNMPLPNIYNIWPYEIHTNTFLLLSKSVCLVIIGGKPRGSGFLLYDNFVLTNAHVIKSAYNFKTDQLTNNITVTFSYEIQESMCDCVAVEDVVCYDFDNKSDWALLKVNDSLPLPNGLLPHVKSVSDTECSNIFIIGHPNAEVKQVDFCSVVGPENRRQVVEENWRKNPGSNDDYVNRVVKEIPGLNGRLTYNSNFYQGSSGSPVFNKKGSLVAMHSGGYFYCDAKGQPQSLMDFGYFLSSIIKQIQLHMV
uniref:Serine protease n=1 Tax=Astatotilapia calliptera TaxID=8154 RepID=A0A3P8P1Z8_ASTCA